jgi:large subunit ribosomal protein L3
VSAIVGKKLGMTRVFDDDGTAIPVTVVEAAPNRITAIRKSDRDGYNAVQLAGLPVAEGKLSRPELGHLKKAGADPMKTLVEFRDAEFPSATEAPKEPNPEAPQTGTPGAEGEEVAGDGEAESQEVPADGEAEAQDAPAEAGERKVGDDVTVADFQPGEKVKVSAISIGKGFQGTIKRHNFSRGPETHGSHNVRAPGSAGASADPARVFPGMKMPGQMGSRRATQLGATVVDVDFERNLLLIKGSVPGGRNATVEVRSVG